MHIYISNTHNHLLGTLAANCVLKFNIFLISELKLKKNINTTVKTYEYSHHVELFKKKLNCRYYYYLFNE